MQTAGKAVAIITARGGSKRIPHKNIKEFCGKPILAYSIEAALASGAKQHDVLSHVHLLDHKYALVTYISAADCSHYKHKVAYF